MKKNAFTLVELLAVIVILAIIALITTPVVFDSIDNSKKSALLRSADFYLDAVEYSVSARKLEGNKVVDGTYPIMGNGNVCLGKLDEDTNICSDELIVEANGDVPTSGKITIEGIQVGDVSLEYQGKTIVKNNKGILEYKEIVCKAVSGDGSNVGNEISCAGENFYVIEVSEDGNTIYMLSKYNLNVGDNAYTSGTLGIQNENVVGVKAGVPTYGNVKLGNFYWYDSLTGKLNTKYGNSYPAFAYDSGWNLYRYVEDYEKYLIQKGVSTAEGTLISYEQLVALGCSDENKTCTSSEYEWVYNASYWSGSAASDYSAWYVSTGTNEEVSTDSQGPSNEFGYYWKIYNNIAYDYIDMEYFEGGGTWDKFIGIRPVINISVSEIG